jgi:hypothetical protein
MATILINKTEYRLLTRMVVKFMHIFNKHIENKACTQHGVKAKQPNILADNTTQLFVLTDGSSRACSPKNGYS